MEKWLSIRTRSKYNKKADLAGGYAKMKRAEEALKDSLTYNEAMKVLGFPKAEWKGGRIFYPRFIRGKQGVQLKHNPVQAAYPFLKRSKFVSADEVRRVYDELEGVSSEDDEGDRE